MLKSLWPRSVGELSETQLKIYKAIRLIAQGLRIYPLTYDDAVRAADEMMDMITRRDAQIAALEQEVKRLNTVLDSCQKDIKAMKLIMEQFEVRLPGDKK